MQGGNPYSIGQAVSLRGGAARENNNWTIQDITPEFATVINGEDLRVVDLNEICKSTQYDQIQYPYQYQNQFPIQQMQYQNQFPQKAEEKPAPVNVVVVTGDKNELSGFTTQPVQSKSVHNEESQKDAPVEKREPDKKGGESSGSSLLDFTKSFFIKKIDS
jgi:hypothetical protein